MLSWNLASVVLSAFDIAQPVSVATKPHKRLALPPATPDF